MSARKLAPHDDHGAELASLPFISDDECVMRLAEAVEAHDMARAADANDSDHLDEVAGLIGRLAVPIEI